MKKFILSIIIFSASLIAQVPDPAFHPMTANGAIGIIWNNHILFWENPASVLYNECYFSSDSALVANMDVSVRIQTGNPSTVYNSVSLNSLSVNQKYFWRIVEYNASGSTPSPVWYFTTIPSPIFVYETGFDSNFDGWEIVGPVGFDNWSWYNSTHTNSSPGEIAFRWDPIFIGDSYVMSPEIASPVGSGVSVTFKYYEDYWSDTVVVGCAITSDNGNTWTTLWDLHATGNVGPDFASANISAPGNFKIGFFYSGNSNNIDFFYVDEVVIQTPLSPSLPPSLLLANASSVEQKVILNWNPGIGFGVTGYYIQRKQGLPEDTSAYINIGQTDDNTFTFSDETVELNKVYTYRISTLSAPGNQSHYGNEATAYVPEFVPVELVSFNANVKDNEVNLKWITASEINNSGFEIERSQISKVKNQNWDKIGFVIGKGTTTEQQNYSFIDKNISSGKYQYRLKQIDFDGTFEYSEIVEVEVNIPTEFSLSQNYPNPFNPTTKIKYTIPSVTLSEVEGSLVMLKVYDVLGNEVAILVNEEKQPGEFEIEFDGSNLSSGIYYYQFKGENFISIKKMVLIK